MGWLRERSMWEKTGCPMSVKKEIADLGPLLIKVLTIFMAASLFCTDLVMLIVERCCLVFCSWKSLSVGFAAELIYWMIPVKITLDIIYICICIYHAGRNNGNISTVVCLSSLTIVSLLLMITLAIAATIKLLPPIY